MNHAGTVFQAGSAGDGSFTAASVIGR